VGKAEGLKKNEEIKPTPNGIFLIEMSGILAKSSKKWGAYCSLEQLSLLGKK